MAERGDSERIGIWKRSMTGVHQVGALTSPAIMANNSSSSALSRSRSCCARVFDEPWKLAEVTGGRADSRKVFASVASSSDQIVMSLEPLPKRTEMHPGSTKKSNSRPPRAAIQSNHCTPVAKQAAYIARGGRQVGERVRQRRPEPRRGSPGTQEDAKRAVRLASRTSWSLVTVAPG